MIMERKFFHGAVQPADVAQALLAEFNRGNLRAQVLGPSDKMIVQVGTRPGSFSGGQTALTVSIQKVEDGIMVGLGEQAWLGVAASLGVSALAALRNPLSLLGRLDDIAQDVESIQLTDRVWAIIDGWAHGVGASMEFTGRLSRLACEYCGTANRVGIAACLACGAPLGRGQPKVCSYCGYAVRGDEVNCANCGRSLHRPTAGDGPDL